MKPGISGRLLAARLPRRERRTLPHAPQTRQSRAKNAVSFAPEPRDTHRRRHRSQSATLASTAEVRHPRISSRLFGMILQ
jgi:hypothetical protein